jgi:NTE family protein
VTQPITDAPDTLVLSGGGTLGEAWMRGLLSGLESAAGLDLRGCEYVLGTSAGAIVAATLVAGRRLEAGDRAAKAWGAEAGADAEPAGGRPLGAALRYLGGEVVRSVARVGAAAASPLAPVTLAGLAPAGRAVRAAALAAAPRPERRLEDLARHLDALGAEFDGRLRVAAVDRRRGRRVLFGAPGAPAATVRDAVLASCAIPWLFAPVEIGGREYVDGGVWSPTNLDAAPGGRGAHVLCLAPTAAARPLRAATSAAVVAEEMALRGRGMRVRTVVPDAASAAAMGSNLMEPGRVEDVLDAAFAQGRALATGSA